MFPYGCSLCVCRWLLLQVRLQCRRLLQVRQQLAAPPHSTSLRLCCARPCPPPRRYTATPRPCSSRPASCSRGPPSTNLRPSSGRPTPCPRASTRGPPPPPPPRPRAPALQPSSSPPRSWVSSLKPPPPLCTEHRPTLQEAEQTLFLMQSSKCLPTFFLRWKCSWGIASQITRAP